MQSPGTACTARGTTKARLIAMAVRSIAEIRSDLNRDETLAEYGRRVRVRRPNRRERVRRALFGGAR
jgi:hypothetical protein